MKIIKWLSERIEDEIDDARTYAEKAIMCKQERPKLAETLIKLSEEEMKHMGILHSEVVDVIEEQRKKTGEPPVAMLAVYEYLHQRQIEDAAKVKALQSMYRS